MISKHFIVSGRVQGVWYRASTQEQAEHLGLRGWVKNLSDGRVELVAGGDTELIDQLKTWLWQGPPLAQVEQIEEEDYEGELPDGFEIR